jgi:hypothetical protein
MLLDRFNRTHKIYKTLHQYAVHAAVLNESILQILHHLNLSLARCSSKYASRFLQYHLSLSLVADFTVYMNLSKYLCFELKFCFELIGKLLVWTHNNVIWYTNTFFYIFWMLTKSYLRFHIFISIKLRNNNRIICVQNKFNEAINSAENLKGQ